MSDIFTMALAAVPDDTFHDKVADNDLANRAISLHCTLSKGMHCLVGRCCFLALLLSLATGLNNITTF